MKGGNWYEKLGSDFSTCLRKNNNVAMENFSQYQVEKKIREYHFNRDEIIDKTIKKWIKEEKHP